MIVVDTNILVDIFVKPTDDDGQARLSIIYPLMRQIETGEVEALVPEVVLHECFYVLVLRLRIINSTEFAKAFSSILQFPGWKMTPLDQTIYLRGTEILEAHPSIRFSDAVIAARAEAYGAELATFDKDLLAVYDGPTWTID